MSHVQLISKTLLELYELFQTSKHKQYLNKQSTRVCFQLDIIPSIRLCPPTSLSLNKQRWLIWLHTFYGHQPNQNFRHTDQPALTPMIGARANQNRETHRDHSPRANHRRRRNRSLMARRAIFRDDEQPACSNPIPTVPMILFKFRTWREWQRQPPAESNGLRERTHAIIEL